MPKLSTGRGPAPIRRSSPTPYAPDRKASRPIARLAGFRGILQVDGYAGYKELAEKGEVQLAFCWSHVAGHFTSLPRVDSLTALAPNLLHWKLSRIL